LNASLRLSFFLVESIHTDSGAYNNPEQDQSSELLGIEVYDDLLGVRESDAVQMGSKVTVWYSAKIVETDHVYEDVNASNGEPVSPTNSSAGRTIWAHKTFKYYEAMFVVGSRDVIQGQCGLYTRR
jgi:hypothetical protein